MLPLAAGTLLPVGATLAVALAVLLLAATAVTALFRLSPDASRGRAREVVTAGARAAGQLAAVSLVIGWAVHRTAALLGFLLLMFAVATRTAGRRVTANGTWWWAALPLAVPVVPVVAALVLSGLLTVPGIAVVPVSGILIGGALTATVLAGRRALDEAAARHGEVEAALSLGLPERPASKWSGARPPTPCSRPWTRPARWAWSRCRARSSGCSWRAPPRSWRARSRCSS